MKISLYKKVFLIGCLINIVMPSLLVLYSLFIETGESIKVHINLSRNAVDMLFYVFLFVSIVKIVGVRFYKEKILNYVSDEEERCKSQEEYEKLYFMKSAAIYALGAGIIVFGLLLFYLDYDSYPVEKLLTFWVLSVLYFLINRPYKNDTFSCVAGRL